jgi:hypothetical protein
MERRLQVTRFGSPSNKGLELTLRSAYAREVFALQLTPLGQHLGSRSSNPSR